MSKFVKLIVTSAVLLSGVVLAEIDPTKELHIQVGTRPLAHSEWVAHQERRACEDQKEQQSEQQAQEETAPEACDRCAPEGCDRCAPEACEKCPPEKLASFMKDACDRCSVCRPNDKDKQPLAQPALTVNLGEAISGKSLAVYHTTHPGAFYFPMAFGLFGETIQLHDHSIWTIYSGHQLATLKWLTSDTIVIVPNKTWFSSYMFCLVNQNTGEAVEANLTVGPLYAGVYTHWIMAIDHFSKEILLEDGSRWDLSFFDSMVYEKWLPNDTIMIGVNNGSMHYSYPNVLINVNTLTYVKASCSF